MEQFVTQASCPYVLSQASSSHQCAIKMASFQSTGEVVGDGRGRDIDVTVP